MILKKIPGIFSVCKVADIRPSDLTAEYVFIGKTDEELSLVCLTERVPEITLARDDGWRAFRITGILDFSLIGILSPIAALLAEAKIGIFAVSTYNTDYVLVKETSYEHALSVLINAGYAVED